MYSFNTIYIWQNQVGEYAFLNGTETTVTSLPYLEPDEAGVIRLSWDTSTDLPEDVFGPDAYMVAFAGDLRQKDLPSGEKSIMDLFTPLKVPELEPA